MRGTHTKKKYATSLDSVIVMAFLSKAKGKKDWNDIIISNTILSLLFDAMESTKENSIEGLMRNRTLERFKMSFTFENYKMRGGSLSKLEKDPSYFRILVMFFCPSDNCVFYAHTGGYAMRESLQQGRRSIVITRNSMERTLIEAYACKMVQGFPNVKIFYDMMLGKDASNLGGGDAMPKLETS